MERNLRIQHARDEADLARMHILETQEYGADIVTLEQVTAWYRRFPEATFRLVDIDTDVIIGGLGLWPLVPEVFSDLCEGKLDEFDMRPTSVALHQPNQRYAQWYFGDILIQPQFRLRKQRWAVRLLVEALRVWLQSDHLAPHLDIVALVYSAQGESLARRMLFQSCAHSPCGHAVYRCQTTPEAIAAHFDTLSPLLGGNS